MLHKDKILSLRDLALEHLPKVRAQRDLVSKHGRIFALQAVAGGPLKTFYSPASTAIEKRAASLLHLVHQHPETTTEGLYPSEDDMEAALQAILLHDARKNEPEITAAMLENARLLCELSGAPLPVWMGCSELPTAQAQTDTPTPAPVMAASAGVEPAKAAPVEPASASSAAGNAPPANTPKFSMTRYALIQAHSHEWPTIRGDIQAASTNGLNAAKARERGWNESDAMDWARSKSKLTGNAKPMYELKQATHNMASLPGRTHELKG